MKLKLWQRIPIIIDFIENFDKIKNLCKKSLLRLKYLFWSKKDKEKSKMLIKEYQLPKDSYGVKGVIINKDIKRKRRSEG